MTSSPGLLPIPFNAAHPVMPDAGMGMGFPSSMMMGDEPFAKKQRMDVTDGLIPEQEFITLHPVRAIYRIAGKFGGSLANWASKSFGKEKFGECR